MRDVFAHVTARVDHHGGARPVVVPELTERDLPTARAAYDGAGPFAPRHKRLERRPAISPTREPLGYIYGSPIYGICSSVSKPSYNIISRPYSVFMSVLKKLVRYFNAQYGGPYFPEAYPRR